MTLLCLDAGNSRLKWGLSRGAQWLAAGALDYAELDRLCERLPHTPARIIVCNVAGSRIAAALATLAETLPAPLVWFASRQRHGRVINGYTQPTRLGADRWAALIAADTLAAGDKIVILAGTATTIDLLAATGQHLGGVILPGLAMMRTALARETAALPLAQGEYQPFPRNTEDAIASGAVEATIGAIERLARRLAQPQLVISGGNAPLLLPHLVPSAAHRPLLVLEGLRLAAETLISSPVP